MGFVVHIDIAVFLLSAVSYFIGRTLAAANAVPNMCVDIIVCSPLLFHQGAYVTITIGMLQICAA